METLLPDLWKAVFDFVPAHHYAVRCTCKTWRAFLGNEPAKITPWTILETLETGGDTEWLAEVLGVAQRPTIANHLLIRAAAVGREDGVLLAKNWIFLAKSWGGAAAIAQAIESAAQENQVAIMRILWTWGADSRELYPALMAAAARGQLEAMEFLGTIGAWLDPAGSALCAAAAAGELGSLELLIVWATPYYPESWNKMCTDACAAAAKAGKCNAMRRLKKAGTVGLHECYLRTVENGQTAALDVVVAEWGYSPSPLALGFGLREASGSGYLETMRKLRDLGAITFNSALAHAAEKGQTKAMELLKQWGATDFNCALGAAVEEGQLKAMELLKTWGAADFNHAFIRARGVAISRGQIAAADLLTEWITTISGGQARHLPTSMTKRG